MRPEYQQIIRHLQSGKKVVTASHRQSRFIHKLWSLEQQKQQATSWQQVECFAWDEWLQQLFDYSTLSICLQKKTVPRILSSFEQRWIWQQLLQKQLQASKKNALVDPLEQQQTLVNSLLQAWKLSANWRIDVDSKKYHSIFESTEETQIFKVLVKQFSAQCQQNNWLSAEQLVDYLAYNAESWQSLTDEKIYFYGFDDWTPQQIHFLKVAAQDVNNEVPESDECVETLHVCASKYAEWQQAAQWSRTLAEADPSAEVAVVIPGLSSEREQVLRIFQEVFQPQLQLEADARVPLGFNISAGEPINQQAIVQSARQWLTLVNGANGELWQQAIVDEFCQSAETERWARAKLRNESGLIHSQFYSVDFYQKQLLKEDVIPLKSWLGIINILLESKPEVRGKKTPGEWCQWTEVFLEKIGWPGASALTSKTYQAKNQWLDNLRQLSAMEKLCGKSGQMNYSAFLNLLDEQISSMNFQAETPSARVQVLGVFEAIGLGFDHLWLSGCQTNNFPSPVNANPWLPVQLQQQLHMPGASSQREQQFVEKLFSGFKRHCEHLHFSYAVADGDAEQIPSAFIEHLFIGLENENKTIAEQLPDYWLQQTAQARKHVKIWNDSQGEKLLSTKVKSGVAILRDQASCPFKAYANFRLDASSGRGETIGVDALQRGNWVHATLEMIWLRLGSQQALLKLDELAVYSLVEDCVREIIIKPSKILLEQQSPLIKLEYDRTIKLVLSWLELDRERPVFQQVEVEQASEVSVGALKFTVRADRIDHFSDGSKIVLDYKTGKVNCKSWFDERITEPQLPLYGLLFAQHLSAIAFAQLNAEACLIKGYGEEDLGIKGIKNSDDWPMLIEQWKTNLATVANEYAQGLATVEPQPNACDYCEFPHLCRRDAYENVAEGESP